MQNRYNCELFVAYLKIITKPHNIDINQCDIVEDFLLHLAEVKEKPKNNVFAIPNLYDPAFCVFAYEIDGKAVDQLLALNMELPELEIKDVTDEVKQSGKMESIKITWQPTLILRITAEGLQKHFLPKLKNHLEKNPKHAKHYERFSHHTCDHLSKDIQEITSDYDIDTAKCDVFEDFLLHLAEVKEKPTRSKFNISGLFDKTHCVFAYGIDYKAVNQLLTLNMQFPELEVTDVTDEVHHQRAGSRAPEELEGKKTLILHMQVEALQKQVLPLFKLHLEKMDQATLKHYQNFSYPFRRVRETFLMGEGLDIEMRESHFLIAEIIGTIVRESGMRSTLLANSLNAVFIPALISIIGSYLNLIVYKEESKQLVPTKGALISSANSRFYSDYWLDVPIPSAKLVALFFNQLQPHSALFYDQALEPMPGDKLAYLFIDNEVLVHPSLLSDVKDTLQFVPHERLAEQRDLCGTLRHGLTECRTNLRELAQSIPSERPFHNLKTRIFELSKKNIEDSAEIKNTIDKIQTELNNIEESKEMRKRPTTRLFSKSFFSQYKKTANKLRELLENMDLITNKKFSVPDYLKR